MQKLSDLSRMICGGWVKTGAIFLVVVFAGIGNIANAQYTFATAQDLGNGEWGTNAVDNSAATADLNAPNIAGFSPFKPLWYKWTAPHDGDVELDTIGPVNTLTNVILIGFDTN